MTHERILRAAIADMSKGRREPHCFRAWVRGEGYVNDGTFATYGTRADYLRQLERAATSELENMNWAPSYAEPGYTAPKRGIVFANWNVFPRGTDELLERAGYAVEWSDEWTTCGDCDKAVRTQEDGWDWHPFYNLKMIKSGELTCLNCAPEEDESNEDESDATDEDGEAI